MRFVLLAGVLAVLGAPCSLARADPTSAVVQVEAHGSGPVRTSSGFVREDGIVVAALSTVRDATRIQVRYAAGDVENVPVRVLAIDRVRDLVLLSANTTSHGASPAHVATQEPVVGDRLEALARTAAGDVARHALRVSRIADVPGLGALLGFESVPTRAADGAPLVTEAGSVVGILRVRSTANGTLAYGVPVSAIARMRADSVWTTPQLPDADDAEGLRAEAALLRGLELWLAGRVDQAVALLEPALESEELEAFRRALPQQVYEVGPAFPIERIRAYWAKPYRITALAYGDGEWGVVLSRTDQPRPQRYRADETIARSTWDELRRQGYALTDLARRQRQWVSTWSQGTGIKSQSLMVVPGFPDAAMRERLERGLRVTSIARGGGMWGVVLSYPTSLKEQIWIRDVAIPAEAIEARWKEGYRITAAAHGEGRWAVILSKGSGLGEQAWVAGAQFPETEVLERWADGYEITCVARGGGHWLVVMSTTSRGR